MATASGMTKEEVFIDGKTTWVLYVVYAVKYCLKCLVIVRVDENSYFSSQQRFVVDGQCVAGGGMHGSHEVRQGEGGS